MDPTEQVAVTGDEVPTPDATGPERTAPEPERPIAITDPEAQKIFDGQALNALIQQARAELARHKILLHLARAGVAPDGAGHPNAIKGDVAKLEGTVTALVALGAELDRSPTGLPSPSPLEVPRLVPPSDIARLGGTPA